MRGAYRPPSSQIPGRVDICVALEATAYAGELGLTATIPLIDVPAVAARAAKEIE